MVNNLLYTFLLDHIHNIPEVKNKLLRNGRSEGVSEEKRKVRRKKIGAKKKHLDIKNCSAELSEK